MHTRCRGLELAALGLLLSPPSPAQVYTISTVAGLGRPAFSGAGGPAVNALVIQPAGVAADAAGNVYVSDAYYQQVFRVSAAGTISVHAGNGQAGSAGDGGPATSAQLNIPTGLAVDSAGNLFIADSGNGRVRKVSSDGLITTATALGGSSVAVDAAGNLYVSQAAANVVRVVRPDGTSTIVAGNGKPGYSGDGLQATQAQLTSPRGVKVDAAGNVYVADYSNHVIRKITPQGIISTVAGNGKAGSSGDGQPAKNASLALPQDIAIDANGNLYIADSSNFRIRWVNSSGIIQAFAGGGDSLQDGPADQAELLLPSALAFDRQGNLLVALSDGRQARRITPQGSVTTIAGLPPTVSLGDNTVATTVPLLEPYGLALDSAGDVYVSDFLDNRIRKISPAGIITTTAGNGVFAGSGDGGPASSASLGGPRGMAFDTANNLYVAIGFASEIRRIAPNGNITTFAAAGFLVPQGVAADNTGNVYIADSGNHRVLRVDTSGKVTTVAGTLSPGFSGDNGPAISAQLFSPNQLTTDNRGNLYIADSGNNRIRQVTADGAIRTVAGNGGGGSDGDGGPATTAQLQGANGVAVDNAGNLYIATATKIRRVDAVTGVITTIAGTGAPGFGGDGGAATAVTIDTPEQIAVDPSGNVFFAERDNQRVRKLTQQQIAAGSVLNGASLVSGPVAPGEILAINLAGLREGQTDVQVLFDGNAAPILSVQANGLTVVVPYGVDGQNNTQLQVVANGNAGNAVSLPVAAAAPGMFTQDASGKGAGLILNADFTPNAPGNPAARGSMVTVAATGEGQTNPQGIDGQVAGDNPPVPVQAVSVQIGGIDAPVSYAGGAPGQRAGYFQVTVTVPDDAPTGDAIPILLTVGGVPSQSGVTISVQ